VLPPAVLLDHLEARLDLLARGPRDAPRRHQTLHDAIGWSYDLLPPAEQALLRRLAVFPNGCSLDAAQAVVAEPCATSPSTRRATRSTAANPGA
jgi:predicted ATPase